MKNTKIDWCDSTWNPVTGCLNSCEYCYARRIAERFKPKDKYVLIGGGITFEGHGCRVLDKPLNKAIDLGDVYEVHEVATFPYGFDPTFHRYRLHDPGSLPGRRNVFVCSMADLFGSWVPTDWIKEVFQACQDHPQHTYLFLTKNTKRYIELAEEMNLPESPNMWYGSTTDKPDAPFFFSRRHNTFVSVEPISEDFGMNIATVLSETNWVIIGAETGNRKGRVAPKKGWIMKFVDACRASGTPLFMKESLRELMGEDFIQQTPLKEARNDD